MIIFEEKKEKRHPNLILVPAEEIAAQKDIVRSFAGWTISIHFRPLDSLEKASWNFVSMATYALLIEIYLLSKFQSFLQSRSRETLEKRVP